MYIYKITNKINDKIYIGQTIRILKKRWIAHKTRCKTNKDDYALYRAMRKYGIDNFNIELVETCNSIEELNKKEIYWIKELNCISPNGYNLTKGGNNNIKSIETIEKLRKQRTKSIIRICRLTGEEKIYSSIKSAVREGFFSACIIDCCKGKMGKHKNYTWKYLNEVAPSYINKKKRKIIKIHIVTGEVKYYESITSVENDGFHRSNVHACLSNKQSSYKNFYWKYEE